MELELLGLSNEHQLDDELPDYVRSQAGMDAKKQVDARTRARIWRHGGGAPKRLAIEVRTAVCVWPIVAAVERKPCFTMH